jgi:GTP-binding protein Era
MTPSKKSGFVAIVGRPNAGKSTLLNAVLGTRISIVTPKAQTTRERVLGILTEEQGQIVFIDTPGIHRAKKGGINEYMVDEARHALEAPTLVWYLVDPRSGLEHEKAVIELLEASKSPVILCMTKSDLLVTEPQLKAADAFAHAIRSELSRRGIPLQKYALISASKRFCLKDLMSETWAFVPEGPLYYPDEDQVSDRPVRFFVAEKIREQLFLKLGEELPYSCAVEIESFDEKSQPPRIEATIHVERDSQKGMIIGKAGAKIKEIGTSARREVEDFVGSKVFLGLRVKVLKDWTRDAEALKRMGYHVSTRDSGRR